MSALKKTIIVVGPLVLIVMLVMNLRTGPRLPGDITMVDIRTGKLENFDFGDVPSIPWKSRKDGERVMLPALKNDDGIWIVSPRYHEVIIDYYAKHGDTGVIDLKHGGFIVEPVGP